MSPEKPNSGKPVQLSEGFLIKQYQSTIWVPKLAYPTQNFLSSYTSQFERNLLAKTLKNPSGNSSTENSSATPASAQFALRQPLYVTVALCHPFLASVSPKRPCVSFLGLCVRHVGFSGALHSTWLPLRGPA